MIGQWTHEWAKDNGVSSTYREEVNSTNDLAKEECVSMKDPHLWVTDYQKRGRGRFERVWVSPPKGTSLLSSWMFPQEKPPQPSETITVGNILLECVQEIWPSNKWRIKEPNDLFFADKKIAGLLLETVSLGNQHWLVIGLGMNVFENPNVDLSSCLKDVLKKDVTQEDWENFLESWWNFLNG